MTTAPKWAATLLDMIDGTPLRRVVVTKPKRRTQSDRMRELRTMRAEMHQNAGWNTQSKPDQEND